MSGCVVLMIDESAEMKSEVSGAKPRCESVATAVNSLLKRLSQGPDFAIAILGYRTESGGVPNVGARWGGGLANCEFVRTSELADRPVTVEQRTRKAPDASGMLAEQTVDFPVWYQPELGQRAPHVAAFKHCLQLLNDWYARADTDAQPPLVVNVFAHESCDGDPLQAVRDVMELDLPCGSPIVLQARLTSSASVPPTLYPSSDAFLAHGPMRDLFERVSEIPDMFRETLREANVITNRGARGMIYNARMADLSRLLSLVQTHTIAWKEAEFHREKNATRASIPDSAEALQTRISNDDAYGREISREKPALFVLLLDQSSSMEGPIEGHNPSSDRKKNELAKQVNGFLAELVIRSTMEEIRRYFDVAVIGYRTDEKGNPLVQPTLGGALAGNTLCSVAEIGENPARIDAFTKSFFNEDTGDIEEVLEDRPVWVDPMAEGGAPMCSAFREAYEVVDAWIAEHPRSFPPMVIHITDGHYTDGGEGALLECVDSLKSLAIDGGNVLLFNSLLSGEKADPVLFPHSSNLLPDGVAGLLFRMSSELPEPMRAFLLRAGFELETGARGMGFNTNMGSTLVRSLDLGS